jgi:hypothetical protein
MDKIIDEMDNPIHPKVLKRSESMLENEEIVLSKVPKKSDSVMENKEIRPYTPPKSAKYDR